MVTLGYMFSNCTSNLRISFWSLRVSENKSPIQSSGAVDHRDSAAELL